VAPCPIRHFLNVVLDFSTKGNRKTDAKKNRCFFSCRIFNLPVFHYKAEREKKASTFRRLGFAIGWPKLAIYSVLKELDAAGVAPGNAGPGATPDVLRPGGSRVDQWPYIRVGSQVERIGT
jgi:hypothetical protein